MAIAREDGNHSIFQDETDTAVDIVSKYSGSNRMKLKSLAAALCALAASQAQAATTAPGTGMLGDVIFQAVIGSGTSQVTLNWDLAQATGTSDQKDLNAKAFISGSVANGTALQNTLLDSFIINTVGVANVGSVRWRVLGVARESNPLTYGALTTATATPNFVGSKTALDTPLNSLTNKINTLGSNSSARLDLNNGVDVGANVDDAKTFTGSTNAFAFATVQATSGFGASPNNLQGLGQLDFYFVHKNPSAAFDDLSQAPGAVLEDKLGRFALSWDANSQRATLSYSVAAVPVPGAVWMLGSGIAALAARRRRKA